MRNPEAAGDTAAVGVVLQPPNPAAAKAPKLKSAPRRVKTYVGMTTSIDQGSPFSPLRKVSAKMTNAGSPRYSLCPSVAGRIGVVAASRGRRRVIGIGVGVIIGARRRCSDRRRAKAKGRRPRHGAVVGMTVPGAVPSAVAAAVAAGDE